MSFLSFKKSVICQLISGIILVTFSVTSVVPPAYAQVLQSGVLNLPVPGTLVATSGVFAPAIIKGITIHPNDPLQMSFIINPGEENFDEVQFENESNRLIKYFLASLTIPENELWVNLSPYEKNRTVPESFGKTQMGLDLLAQDYMLKQLTSSMMYPEDETGKEFWRRVHQLAYEKFGTTDIPMNTFNKIWIVPEKAVIFEHANSAVIVESKLKVLLEEDYLALNNHQAEVKHGQAADEADVITGVSLDVVREVLIPEIEKEINHGKTFSQLRQIYHAVILANWYKENLKESLLGQVYVDQNKTSGIETQDKELNQKIYDQYIESFKKGVYNYIKEDYDPISQQTIPRQYFSGGGDFTHTPDEAIFSQTKLTPRQLVNLTEVGNRNVEVRLDNAMVATTDDRNVLVEKLNPAEGRFREGSGAYIYGEEVVKAKWYQANLAFDLESVVQRIDKSGDDVVLDVSAGTGGASVYLLNRLRTEGKRIKKLVLTDVGYGQSRGYMEYARAALYKQFEDVVDEIEFYILPQTGEDSTGAHVFASVSDIPDLKADHIMMENAVHLIPKSQLVRTFKAIKDVMNPGATLTMGSGDIQGITIVPENAVGIHQLFDFVSAEIMNLMTMDSKYDSIRDHYTALYGTEEIREKKKSAFPTSNSQDDIYAALEEAGFGSIFTGNVEPTYNQVILERADYKPFITRIQSYVQSRIIPELAKTGKTEDPYQEVREELVDRAYENIFDQPLEQFASGYSLSWTKYTVSTEKRIVSPSEDQAVIVKPVVLQRHSNIPGFRDIKSGQLFLEKFDKLQPLTEKFFELYGGNNQSYNRLRELGKFLEGVEVRIGNTRNKTDLFDFDASKKQITIDREFMDFLFTTGRKKVYMSFMAKALIKMRDGKEADTTEIEQLITGGKISLFAKYETRLDETVAIFKLKQKVAKNDTPKGAVNPYYLTEEDIRLVVSDYLHRGKILNERKLRKYLLENFGAYGEITAKQAQGILEKFYQENSNIVSRAIGKEESGIDELKSKLDSEANIIEPLSRKVTEERNQAYMKTLADVLKVISDEEVSDLAKSLDENWEGILQFIDGMQFSKETDDELRKMGDIPQDTTQREELRKYIRSRIGQSDEITMTKLMVSYGLHSDYMADPAYKGRSLIWDIEVERQDEVNFGGKSAHTGEMMYAPNIITLPNFFSSGATFQTLFSSNSFKAYKPHLVEKIDELERFIKFHKKDLDVYSDELKENLEHQINEMRVVVDESTETVSVQLEQVVKTMRAILKDIDSGQYESLKDYFSKVGANLDQQVKSIKEKKKEILVELVRVKKRISEAKGNEQNGVVLSALEHQAESLTSQLKSLQLEYEAISFQESNKLLIAARLMVLSTDLRAEIKNNLRALAKRIGVPIEKLVLAIRSSAVGEDSETASFAGRQDTYIFVTAVKTEKDPEGLDNIINSWIFNQASLFNKRAIDYRFDQGLPTFDEDVEISTLFQMMFLSELSYIAFSVDRDTGFPSISSSFTEGQGESLVSGAESGSKFILTYDGKLLVRDRGDRRFMIVETAEGLGKQKLPIPERKRKEFAITDQKLLSNASAYFKILHDYYEGYVDLEGAIRSKRDSEGAPIYLTNGGGEIEKDERGFPRKEWMMVSTQARPETVVSTKDEDVIELKRIVVTDKAYKDAEAAGQVLPFKFIAKTGGTAQGTVTWVLDKSPESLAKTTDQIMGTEQSDPDMNSAMVAAKGIIAALGGPNSHTMIVASEYGLVAITGLSNATFEELQKAIPEGTEITIDAERGRIILGVSHQLEIAGEDFNVRDIPDTGKEQAKSSTIVASVSNAMKQWSLSKVATYKGIGLQRLELVLTDVIGIYPDALLAYDNMIRHEAGQTYTGPILKRPEDISTQDLIAYENLLDYETAKETVEATTVELQEFAHILLGNPEQADVIQKKIAKAEQKRRKARETVLYLEKVNAPMLDRGEHAKLISHLVAYENLLKSEKGQKFEGSVLDRKNDAELIESIKTANLIKSIESGISGYNSGEDFYVSALSEWLTATAETLQPPKIEAVVRAQKISDPKLRLQVLGIVNEYYKIGLGHRHPLNALWELYESLMQGTEELVEGSDAYKLYYLINLLDKRLYIRLDDRKSDEYEAVIGAKEYIKREVNPMKGFRGLDLLLSNRQTLEWQLRAIRIVAEQKRGKIAVFAPLVRRPEDVVELLRVMDEVGLTQDLVERGIMTEIPTNSINIEDFLATGIDFTSTGGNDALQTTARVDRNTSNEELKNDVTGYSPSIVRFNASITASTVVHNKKFGTECENGFCGNEPSVKGQEDYGAGLSLLGHTSVSVTPQAYQKVATNLANQALPIRDVFRDNMGFQFEINPESLKGVRTIDYEIVNIGDIRLGMGIHYQALRDYDNELQQKALDAELDAEQKVVYQKVRGVLQSNGRKNLNQAGVAIGFYRERLKRVLVDAAKKAAAQGRKLHIGTDHVFSSEYIQLPLGKHYELVEANPEYGYHGLVRALNKDRSFLEIDLDVIKEVSQEFDNIVLDVKVVRNFKSLETLQQLFAKSGLNIPVFVDVEVTANIFEISEILDKTRGIEGISISDPIRLTSDMMALEQNNINGVRIKRKDVQYQLKRPVLILASAAQKNGKKFFVDESIKGLTIKQDQSMLAEDFVLMLEEAIVKPGEGELFQWERPTNRFELYLNKEYILAHRTEFIKGVRELREALLNERKINFDNGLSFGALEAVVGTNRAFVILAAGKLLGLWSIYPDDELSEGSKALTYRDPSEINFPAIWNVNREAIGISDAAMTANEKDLGGIDLDPNLFELETKGDGQLIFPRFKGNVENLNINGLIPVIINVIPIISLPVLLGLSDSTEDESNNLSYDSLDPLDRKDYKSAGHLDQLSLLTN